MLISQLKNPWQYVCIGTGFACVLYFKIDNQWLFSIFPLAMALAYFCKKVTDFICLKKEIRKRRKKILFNLLHLNDIEREILAKAFFSGEQTMKFNALEDLELFGAWNSLSQKGVGVKHTGVSLIASLTLTIPQYVWEIIEENQNEIFHD